MRHLNMLARTMTLAAWLAASPAAVDQPLDPAVQRLVDQADGELPTEGTVTTVIASTATTDRYGDIVEQHWDLQAFRDNPVILWNHDADQGVIGRAVRARINEDGNLEISILWDESPENPLGRRTADQFRRGFMSAVSVGFQPGAILSRGQLADDDPRRAALGDHGVVLGSEDQPNELWELSAVPIPANPQALVVGRSGDGIEIPQVLRTAVLALVRSDPEVRRALSAIAQSAALQAVDGLQIRNAPGDNPEPEPDLYTQIAAAENRDGDDLLAQVAQAAAT